MTPDLWPPAGLRVRSGDLELRYPDDDDLFALARLASAGVHDPARMPFSVPWTRGTPDEVAQGLLRYQWRVRAEARPDDWRLELAVVVHDATGERPVGVQALFASRFPVVRSAETGSWLALRAQGRGLGTRARWMALHLLFEGLGAREATTAAFADNDASNGVTARIGYEDNGSRWLDREGVAARLLEYRLSREAWEAAPGRPAVELAGVGPVRGFLGLGRRKVALGDV